MTPRERIFAALNHRMPDRIPMFEIWIDALYAELICDDSVGIYPHLGQDCIFMPTSQPFESNAWKTGIDEFGRIWQNGSYVGGVVDSLESLSRYNPPLSNTQYYFPIKSIKAAKHRYPEHCLIWGTHIGPFTAAYMAMGFSTFFTSIFDSPSFINKVLKERTDWCIAMYKNAQDLGAEVLILADDAGTNKGPMISPEMWREFILPYHREIVDALDVPVIWHSDGDVTLLLSMAIEAGFKGYHGVDVISGMNLKTIKMQYGQDLTLIGNADIRLLFSDDLGAVREEVNRCISEGSPGGGYMFASCNSICDGMNPLSVAEMYKQISKVGFYST